MDAQNDMEMGDGMSTGEQQQMQADFTKTSSRRLMVEMNDVIQNPPPLCSAGLKSDDLYHWVATIIGPPNSVYEGGVFSLNLLFPKEYPFKPPKVTFKTKIYHCNVSPAGNICLDILKKNWSPALTVSSVLLSICSLLEDCNPNDPMEDEIARLYMKDRAEHDKQARHFTKLHAFP